MIGCALILAAPVLVSVARADGPSLRGGAEPEERGAPEEPARVTEMMTARIEMGQILSRMMSTSRRARDMLRDARKRGARRQVSCLDEALSRSDVAYRSARDQAGEALAAYGRNDLASARAARARVADLDEVQRLAARDGAACLPRPAAPVTERIVPGTFVRLTVEPNIAPDLTR